MDEVRKPKADAPVPTPPSLLRQLSRWAIAHPATVFWLSLAGMFVIGDMVPPDWPRGLGVAGLLLLGALALVSYVSGVIGVFRPARSPARTRLLQGLSLLVLPAWLVLIAMPYIKSAPRMPRLQRAASDARTAATQALVFGKDKGVYPTSLKALRDSGYANVPDTDRWDRPYVLAPILAEGRTPQNGDDVYVYSKGACGTGTYEPARWRKDSSGSLDSGKCGAVGYSSVHGAFIGQGS